jgi:selenide,water dikinase
MKRVVLLGGGHAHAYVLRMLIDQPLHDVQLTLVTPYDQHTYSGMLPGLVAGHYVVADVQIDVARLAAAAGATLVRARVTQLDAAQRRVGLADGATLEYDIASLNLGSLPNTAPVPGSAEHALAAKPFEAFLEGWNAVLAGPSRPGAAPLAVALVGAGAAGVELAMAIAYHLHALGRAAAVTLYSDRPMFSGALARRVHAALARSGVHLREPAAVARVEPGGVIVTHAPHATRERYDAVVWTAGAAPLPWLRATGLDTDPGGFVLVDDTLRSVSHPAVFAVGDCATLRDNPHPKSGVYAVRHGDFLARNLRYALAEVPLHRYRPQRRALALISCGARHAIADWSGWTAEGAWVWRWKDWLDQRWVRRFRI